MAVPQTELIVLKASEEIGRYALEPGVYTIGCSSSCSIQIDVPGISRQHAQLSVAEDGRLSLQDLGSSHGSMVDEQPVSNGTAVSVLPNQTISLGSAVSLLVQQQSARIGGSEVSLAEEEQNGLPPEFRTPERYAVGEQIAKGGMGAILNARQSTIRREVAMKVILGAAEESPRHRLRFIEEAQITGQLEHPNIVPVHDAGIDGEGRIFYTMKLVKGITLKKILELLKKGAPGTVQKYPLANLLTIFQKVCDAVAFAHSKGVIHRDLKPENIMIGSYGEVLVMDWGLAKLVGRKSANEVSFEVASARFDEGESHATMDGSVMGTPSYMAPEQARGEVEKLDPRTDIFSLGVILYEILTLERPFTGKNGREIIERLLSGEPPVAPAAFNKLKKDHKLPYLPGGEVPESLSAVAMKALSYSEEVRYQNVGELQTELTAYQNGFATSAEKASLRKQLILAVKRHKAAAIGLAAVLLVGTVLGINVFLEGRRAERGEADAKAKLYELRKTAPIFHAQARVDLQEGRLDAALNKIGYALQLDEENADYHLFRANLREAGPELAAAAEDYRRVLALRPTDAEASSNLVLCEKLLRESGGRTLGPAQQRELLAALRAQKRFVESAPLAALIDPDVAMAKAAITARLREWVKQPGWRDSRVEALPDGTFKVELGGLAVGDLSVLTGQPVSVLDLGLTGISELSSLRGLPLKELHLMNAKAADLSPLRGMPLEFLYLSGTPVTDLAPLRGMKLQKLNLSSTGVSDLGPLAGMPLTSLDCTNTAALFDLSALRGAPLQSLFLTANRVTNLAPLAGAPLRELKATLNPIADLAPLAQCIHLQILDVQNCQVADLSPLIKLKLTRINLRNNAKIVSLAPLRGQPLQYINLAGTKIHDLSPLVDCLELEEVVLPETPIDLDLLRKLPKLRLISVRDVGGHPGQTAEQFWKEYDAKKAAEKN